MKFINVNDSIFCCDLISVQKARYIRCNKDNSNVANTHKRKAIVHFAFDFKNKEIAILSLLFTNNGSKKFMESFKRVLVSYSNRKFESSCSIRKYKYFL